MKGRGGLEAGQLLAKDPERLLYLKSGLEEFGGWKNGVYKIKETRGMPLC